MPNHPQLPLDSVQGDNYLTYLLYRAEPGLSIFRKFHGRQPVLYEHFPDPEQGIDAWSVLLFMAFSRHSEAEEAALMAAGRCISLSNELCSGKTTPSAVAA